MNLYTVYDSPNDYPNKYVVRRWEVSNELKDPIAMNIIIIGNDLEEIRKQLVSMGLFSIPRHETDDKKIIETWL